jgi:hypothetical protein
MNYYNIQGFRFTVSKLDSTNKMIRITAKNNADLYSCDIHTSFRDICDSFDNEEVIVSVYPGIVLLKLSYITDHIGLILTQ